SFLSNAINYSSQRNKLILRLYTNHNKLYLHIQHYAIGITETDQNPIFQPFYPLHKPTTTHSPPTPLPLSITKHILEPHNPTIDLKSPPRKG
ncbi:ATP-binding protein, partial [Staphylococcus epidermidis]|uniref:ATP-binding protein n=1 Tax=Staphylococcus epidermidis TaxID=1282 RepID=UPI0034D95C39